MGIIYFYFFYEAILVGIFKRLFSLLPISSKSDNCLNMLSSKERKQAECQTVSLKNSIAKTKPLKS